MNLNKGLSFYGDNFLDPVDQNIDLKSNQISKPQSWYINHSLIDKS